MFHPSWQAFHIFMLLTWRLSEERVKYVNIQAGEVTVNRIDLKLKELGITLPKPVPPVANYVPWAKTGNLVFLAGQLPLADGKLQFSGPVKSEAEGAKAARVCGINLIAQLREACGGDLDRVTRIVKLVGLVDATGGGISIPAVVNGASDLMVEVFGEAGKHARSAVGVAALPLGAGVEVEAIVEIA
jgi:enamine deaminase RidA (YjgF/YER057c/UK114 family)